MATYKHLFFDLDHTLWDFDSNSKQTLHSLLGKYELDKNLSSDKFIVDYQIHNKLLWDKYEKGTVDQKTLRFQRFHLALNDQGISDDRLTELISEEYLAMLPFRKILMDGAKEVLTELQKKYVLHLITNGFEEVQILKIRNSGIEDFFEEIITSERAGVMKPNKEIFEYALSKTGASTGESLMIGDNFYADIMGAKQVGIDQVWFNPYKEISDSNATYEIENLKELLNFL